MSAVPLPAASPAVRPARSPLVPFACAALFAVAVPVFGPQFVSLFSPPGYTDFVQEWLSARNYWAGDPVYLPQREGLLRRTGEDLPALEVRMPWNAHPPVAVLLALPFGLTSDYVTAHLAWNLLTFPLMPLALVLVARELHLRVPWWGALACAALVLAWNAVQYQLHHGQLNCLILYVLVLAWVADRRGRALGAGALAGLAAALKLFPALRLVYFVAGRKWRAAGALVLVAGALNLVALAALGFAAFETYFRDVVPSLDVYRRAWMNLSLTGYFTRLGEALGAPQLGKLVALGTRAGGARGVGRRAPRDRGALAGPRVRAGGGGDATGIAGRVDALLRTPEFPAGGGVGERAARGGARRARARVPHAVVRRTVRAAPVRRAGRRGAEQRRAPGGPAADGRVRVGAVHVRGRGAVRGAVRAPRA